MEKTMELCVLESGKLRVVLTPRDMQKYEIDCKTLDYGNTKTRRAVWDILDEAKEKTGFDAALGRILIQVYPERSGGCEIYITKLEKDPPPDSAMGHAILGEKLPALGSRKPAVYGFSDLSSLLRACRELQSVGYNGESRVYTENTGTSYAYYLVLYETGNGFAVGHTGSCPFENLFVGEYGNRLPGADACAYIREHGTPICEKNAVKTLARLT